VPGILFSVAAVPGILSSEVVVVPLSSDSFLSSEAVVVVPLSFDSLLSSEAVVGVPLSSDILLFSPVEEEEAFLPFSDSSPFSASEVAPGLSVEDTLEEEEEKMGHRTTPVGRLRNLLLLLPRSYDPVPSPPRGLAAAGLDSNLMRRRRRYRCRCPFRRSRRSPIDEDLE